MKLPMAYLKETQAEKCQGYT